MVDASSSYPPLVRISYDGSGKYRLDALDDAPDIAGEPTTDEEKAKLKNSKTVDEAELNQFLSPLGLQASQGVIVSADGFTVHRTEARIMQGGDPVLPDANDHIRFSGSQASGEYLGSLSNKLNWLNNSEEMAAGLLNFLSMSVLMDSAILDMRTAKNLRIQLQENKKQAKSLEIGANEEKISSERAAAWTTFAVSLAAVGLSVASGWSPKFSGAALSISSSINNIGTAFNKQVGPQRDADEAQLDSMRWGFQGDILDQSIESARSTYDEAKELFKLALRVIQEHVERQTQIVQKFTS